VTITGTGLANVSGTTGVEFGTNNATSYTINSDTSHHRHFPGGSR
jgi:hypothetical protein